jgi:hypothetical protein
MLPRRATGRRAAARKRNSGVNQANLDRKSPPSDQRAVPLDPLDRSAPGLVPSAPVRQSRTGDSDETNQRITREWIQAEAKRKRLANRILKLVEELADSRETHGVPGMQKDAVHVVSYVVGALVAPINFLNEPKYIEAMARSVGEGDKRARCIAAIRHYGKLVCGASVARQYRYSAALARFLANEDGAFAALVQDSNGFVRPKAGLPNVEPIEPELVLKLRSFTEEAKGKRNGKSAARILAELIYEEQDALGIKVDPKKRERAEVARIAKRLVRDLSDDSAALRKRRLARQAKRSPTS